MKTFHVSDTEPILYMHTFNLHNNHMMVTMIFVSTITLQTSERGAREVQKLAQGHKHKACKWCTGAENWHV